METNTLVTHTKMRTLGIGCVSKVMGNKLKVNFGSYDEISCNEKALKVVDTTGTKTISFHSFQRQSIGGNVKDSIIIIGNEVKQYVGIGWVTLRVVTMDDLKKYKRVI